MNHVVFDQAAGGVPAATAFRDLWNELFGYPRGPQMWNQNFAEVTLNVAAQDNPLAPDARAGIDVSCGFALAGGDYEDPSQQVFILDMTDTYPLPVGAVVEDVDMNSPEWSKPFGFGP